MITIINDEHMVYNVNPEMEHYSNGENVAVFGGRDGYMIEGYFNRDKLFKCVYLIVNLNVILMFLTLYQQKYLFNKGGGQPSTRYETIKLNIHYISYNFNRLYISILPIICIYIYFKEMNIYSWHYDCGPSEDNNTIQSSTYYYSIFNIDISIFFAEINRRHI